MLPYYGNTHSSTTATSLQSTSFREEARDIIRNAVNASEHDAVIFTGAGVTAGINKLVHALQVAQTPGTVVLVGPFEHHANILPWREAGALVVTIRESSDGVVDMEHLDDM